MRESRLDAYLQLVADRRRRQVLEHLRHEADPETTIDDLVDRLYTGEPITVDHWPVDRDNLAIQLHHSHLPKLSDLDVVEYHPESGTVRYRADEEIETVLDSLQDGASIANP